MYTFRLCNAIIQKTNKLLALPLAIYNVTRLTVLCLHDKFPLRFFFLFTINLFLLSSLHTDKINPPEIAFTSPITNEPR